MTDLEKLLGRIREHLDPEAKVVRIIPPRKPQGTREIRK